MTIEEVFQDKTIKAKQKVSIIGDWLMNNQLPIDELLAFADTQKTVNQTSCIEAIEYATKTNATIANENVLEYVIHTLGGNEPRLKWESAKVIGNIAHLYPNNLDKAIEYLLTNTNHEGTVPRWATAYALGEILKLKTKHNTTLLPKIERLVETEENNGVKKKYTDALKKVMKS